jgi:hypothetical protein
MSPVDGWAHPVKDGPESHAEKHGPDAVTSRRSGLGNHQNGSPLTAELAHPPRAYWLNHSMVRFHACSAAGLL